MSLMNRITEKNVFFQVELRQVTMERLKSMAEKYNFEILSIGEGFGKKLVKFKLPESPAGLDYQLAVQFHQNGEGVGFVIVDETVTSGYIGYRTRQTAVAIISALVAIPAGIFTFAKMFPDNPFKNGPFIGLLIPVIILIYAGIINFLFDGTDSFKDKLKESIYDYQKWHNFLANFK